MWIHDYHLMRLPYQLRSKIPNIKMAWFLHTPFPTSEVYRILPVRRELLEGPLCADLVGFHTYDYARHFLSACSRVLDVESTPKGIEYKDHFACVGVYPIGIDPGFISRTLKEPDVQERIDELTATFSGRKVLLGVDRLDYIKGVPHKLLGFELFLARHPEWIGKVTLIQVCVPTRSDVAEYKDLNGQVNELVGRINGAYGTLEYSPIHYINQHTTQGELFAIYNVADVCLVTSVRDGMNLVSHEYVAAQGDLRPAKDGPGVLVRGRCCCAGGGTTTTLLLRYYTPLLLLLRTHQRTSPLSGPVGVRRERAVAVRGDPYQPVEHARALGGHPPGPEPLGRRAGAPAV